MPLALLFEESGFPVIGFDIDPTKPEALNRGESYIRHIGPARLVVDTRNLLPKRGDRPTLVRA